MVSDAVTPDGATNGVLAVAIHTIGALGKLFAEVVENIDMKPVEGVTATGAHWTAAMRYGAVPQILSNFVSYALLRFEINVRGATVMGFVGAGGIGVDLVEAIRKFYYSDVSAILVLISHWFPARERARAYGFWMMNIAIASTLGP